MRLSKEKEQFSRYFKGLETLDFVLIGLVALNLILKIAFALVNKFIELDPIAYHRIGSAVAQGLRSGHLINTNTLGLTSHIQIGYYYIVGFFYYLFGSYPLVMQIVNILISLFTAIILFKLTNKLFKNKAVAWLSALLFLYFPANFFWATQNMKDSLLLLLIVFIFWLFMGFFDKMKKINLVLLVIALGLLMSLRSYLFFLIIIAFVFYLLIRNKKISYPVIILFLLLASSFLILSQFSDLEWNYLAKFDIATLNHVRESTYQGLTSFNTDIEYRHITDVIFNLPRSLYSVIVGPSEKMCQGVSGNLCIFLYYNYRVLLLIYLLALYGIYKAIKRKVKFSGLFLLYVIMSIGLFAVFQANYGTLLRQMMQATLFIFPFAAFGLFYLFFKPNNVLKRIFDLLAALVVLIILSPLFLIISIVIKFTDKGPIFFLSERVGKNGRIIKMIKFRTMFEDQSQFAIMEYDPQNDPRVTRVGKWLRRFSLDELPQLFNIIKGEMSVVGPRPAWAFRLEESPEFMEQRNKILPGLTGYQQVNGRNDLLWEEIMKYDLYYIENHSLYLDLLIVLKTFAVVISGKGRNATEKTFKDVSKSFYEYIQKTKSRS